jgi:hypothetical protein
MPAPAGTPSSGGKSLVGFLGFVILLHFFDCFVRYGTLPFAIGSNPGSPGLWLGFAFFYGVVFLIANKLEAFEKVGTKSLVIIALIAYVWGPLWSIAPNYFPSIKYLAAIMMIIAPFWLLAVVFATQAAPTWFSLGYTILWFFIVMFMLFPNIQQYAQESGYPMPNSLSPGMVLSYSWEKAQEGWTNLISYGKQTTSMFAEEATRSYRMATGDYYTGQVDTAAKKRLGVYLENFRTSEPIFYDNTPVMAYATMKAETIDKELNINILCDADSNTTASMVRPKESFSVLTSDQYDIDCVWNKGVLPKGSHTLRLRSEFEFTTRAYLKAYMIDMERLKEYRRQNVDPLANIPDKSPIAIYTSGPVRIGMSIGQQPVAIGASGDPLSSLGLTIENAWEGKVLDLTNVFIIIPAGLKIANIEGVGITESSCDAMAEEERATCDDTLVKVYALTTEELSKAIYKNLTMKTFRIPIDIENSEKVLGKAPLGVQNFKASVQYRYRLERTTSATVRESQPQATV